MLVYELVYYDSETDEVEMVCESLKLGDIELAHNNDRRRNGHRIEALYDVIINKLVETEDRLIPHKIMDWADFEAVYLNNNSK